MIDPEGLRRRVRERLKEQGALVRSLLTLKEQLQASLFVRYGECGKETCCCRQGRKHGPYYVLSLRTDGKSGFAYLDRERLEEARALVSAHREFRAGMRRLQRVNAELVTLLRRYQTAMARRGGRRIGLAAVV